MCQIIHIYKSIIPDSLMNNIKIYVDDILVHAESIDIFLKVTNELVSIFKLNGVTTNCKKSKFSRKEVNFLGYTVSTNILKKI